MKRKDIIYVLIVGILAPWLVIGAFELIHEHPESCSLPIMDSIPMVTDIIESVSISVFNGEENMEMALEDYIAGVLLGELPENFSMEAKKAQAIVARTYALRITTGYAKHTANAVCTDPGCCQGFVSPADYHGTEKGVEEAMAAAQATAGMVLVYNGNLIEATYFSCSGGQTEDAVAVWGTDVPYLRSVESPGEEFATHYTDTVTYTLAEFLRLLNIVNLPSGVPLLGEIEHTAGGGVASLQIAGQTFAGTQIRNVLGLRSTAFTMSQIGSNVIITTRGYGHRVGMSQYGAEAMAVSGCTFEEILSHYYQGTELVNFVGQ